MRKEFGILAFWLAVTFLISTILGFYYYPAEQKIEKLEKMIDESDKELKEIEIDAEELKKELDAMNNPFYIEKILRVKYKWVPKKHVEKLEEVNAS